MKIFITILLILIPVFSFADARPTGSELIQSKFSLIDNNGNTVTEKTYYGKYTLVFFGFSHCPRVCPVGLHTMVSALNELGEAGNNIVPLFITIDPERDDVERMKEFTGFFGNRLIGLTGSKEDIDRASKAFRAYYSKIKGKNEYSFEHSSVIYFMDKQGQYLAHFASQNGTEDIVEGVKDILLKEKK